MAVRSFATRRALRVLEVGAGNGELSRHLPRVAYDDVRPEGAVGSGRRTVEPCYSVVACDDHPSSNPIGIVERADYKAALSTYRPHLVLCSWMPMGVDWSADFRRGARRGVHGKGFSARRNLGEYILLGEV